MNTFERISSVPLTHTQYAQFDERCTCGRRFAILQRDFIKREKELLSEGLSLSETRLKIMEEMKIYMLCCREKVTTYSMQFIFDTGYNAGVITTDNSGGNLKMGNTPNFVGEEFLPATRNRWGFNPNDYCSMIMEENKSPSERLGIYFVNSQQLPLTFYNLASKTTTSYPINFRSNISPPNNFN